MNKKIIALRNNDSTNSANNVSGELATRNENEGISSDSDNKEIQNNTDNNANGNTETKH